MKCYAFEITVKGRPEWAQTINATTLGRAKAEYFSDLRDAWPDVPFTALRGRKVGGPSSSEQFIRNARYRGLPALRCGDTVRVGDSSGVVVGHDASANFRVQFAAESRYAGAVLSVHPGDFQPL